MKTSAAKVLKKLKQLRISLDRARKEKKEFKMIHQEILNLCRLVFDKKSDYETIDVPYPEQITVIVHERPNGETKRIDVVPDIAAQRARLSKELLAALRRIHKLYSLRKQVEPNDALKVMKHLKAIQKDLAAIKKYLKLRCPPSRRCREEGCG